MGYYHMKELFEAADKPVKIEAAPESSVEKPDPFASVEPVAPVVSEGPFYSIRELIQRIEIGEYDNVQ